MDKVNSDDILGYMKGLVESKQSVPREDWLTAAFNLEILRLDEAKLLNQMRQDIAIKRRDILYSQDGKKNVTACNVDIEALDEFRFMKNQEEKLYTVDELVRIAKKNSDTNF
jgi:hypothetical protein